MFGNRTGFSIGFFLLVFAAQIGPAQAYIEPGTGAMILQILLGGVAGLVVVWKLFWYRIKEMFVPGFKANADSENTGENGAQGSPDKSD